MFASDPASTATERDRSDVALEVGFGFGAMDAADHDCGRAAH